MKRLTVSAMLPILIFSAACSKSNNDSATPANANSSAAAGTSGHTIVTVDDGKSASPRLMVAAMNPDDVKALVVDTFRNFNALQFAKDAGSAISQEAQSLINKETLLLVQIIVKTEAGWKLYKTKRAEVVSYLEQQKTNATEWAANAAFRAALDPKNIDRVAMILTINEVLIKTKRGVLTVGAEALMDIRLTANLLKIVSVPAAKYAWKGARLISQSAWIKLCAFVDENTKNLNFVEQVKKFLNLPVDYNDPAGVEKDAIPEGL